MPSDRDTFLLEIQKKAGRSFVKKLLEDFGGQHIYIPRKLNDQRAFDPSKPEGEENVISAITKAMSREFADRLADELGGTRIYIPKRRFKRDDTPLVAFLGGVQAANEFLEKLKPHYGGGSFVALPKGRTSNVWKKSVAIQDDLISGDLSVRAISRKHKTSERSVYAHRAKLVECGLLSKRHVEQKD